MVSEIIYFDMDGVVADFDRRYTELTGIAWKHDPDRTSEEEEIMWARLNDHPTFFLDLPWVPGSQTLTAFTLRHARQSVGVLSAAAKRMKQSHDHKLVWCRREMPWMASNNIVIVSQKRDKAKYAAPGAILIDDYYKNVDHFVAAGGKGILFKNPLQVMAELQEIIQAPARMYDRAVAQMKLEVESAK